MQSAASIELYVLASWRCRGTFGPGWLYNYGSYNQCHHFPCAHSTKGAVVAAFATAAGEEIRYFDSEEHLEAAARDHTRHTVARRQSAASGGFPKVSKLYRYVCSSGPHQD